MLINEDHNRWKQFKNPIQEKIVDFYSVCITNGLTPKKILVSKDYFAELVITANKVLEKKLVDPIGIKLTIDDKELIVELDSKLPNHVIKIGHA